MYNLFRGHEIQAIVGLKSYFEKHGFEDLVIEIGDDNCGYVEVTLIC
jgi:hypothetical protein